MERAYIEDQVFEKIDFTETVLAEADYENCRFLNCNFSNANLSNIHFAGCSFSSCNLSMVTIMKTAFRDSSFADCKLLGLHFENCHPFLFEVRFTNCLLNLSSFYEVKLAKTKFINTSLQEVDFTGTDLTAAVFDNCDLLSARFDQSILEKADLRTAYNYSIDPSVNRIKKAKFSMPWVVGLLDALDIEVE